MPSLAKHLPNIDISERGEGRDLELQEVVLAGIEVDGVHATRGLQAEGEDVVAGRGDCQDYVVAGGTQEAGVGAVVFPGEGVDVRVVETGVFREELVVVDSPVVVLVPGGVGGGREELVEFSFCSFFSLVLFPS